MAVTEKTFDEVLNSLTGFDEIAVEQATGKSLDELVNKHKFLMMRAIVAVDVSRTDSIKYKDAYQRVMGMPMGEIPEYFTEPADDPMPDEPDSAPGKGSSQPE